MRWIWLMMVAGCDLNLDFHSEATSITASGQDDGRTRVTICAGPSELLSCNNKVAFQVAVGSETKPATEGFLSFGVLEADFATVEADTPIAVIRSDSAMANASLPAPFTLAGEQDGSKIRLTWNPAGDHSMAWNSTVTCDSTSYFGDSTGVRDSGELTISAGDLPGSGPGTCGVEVTLTRTRDGTLDPAFPSGSKIVGEQARTFAFELAR